MMKTTINNVTTPTDNPKYILLERNDCKSRTSAYWLAVFASGMMVLYSIDVMVTVIVVVMMLRAGVSVLKEPCKELLSPPTIFVLDCFSDDDPP